MAQKDSKFIPLSDKQGSVFTWWIVNNSPSWTISYAKTPYARNFRVNGGWISIRPWFYQFWNDLWSSDYPKGIGVYFRGNSSDRIIVRYNVDWTHKLVSITPDTWIQTSISTAWLITSDDRMNFIGANDSLYCMNGIDLIWKLNWTTYTNPTPTIKPKFWVWFNNSMWVAWDPATPNRMFKSSENNPESYSWTWNDIFDSWTPITWLCASLQTLYVFSENYIDMINSNSIKQIWSSLVYTSVPLESMEWALSHNTIVNMWKDVYFLSRSWKIKKLTPNNMTYDVLELSHRANRWITPTMDWLDTDQSAWFCYVIPEKQLIKWFLKTKWSTYNDIVIIYNTEYDEFMIDDHNVCYGWVNYHTNNYTISQIEPKVYRDEEWASDDDSPIQFRYNTKVFNFWEPTILKCLWQTRTYLSINVVWEIYQNIYADWSLVDSKLIDNNTIIPIDWIGTEAIGTEAIGTEWYTPDTQYSTVIVRDKWYLRVKAKSFYVSYVSYKLGTQCLLQSLEPQVEMLNFLTTSHF